MFHRFSIQRFRRLPWPKSWLWYAAFAFAVFAVGWEGREWCKNLCNLDRPPRDFFQEWASAKNALAGRPVYAPHSETIPLYLSRPVRTGRGFVEANAHPPASVVLALPFAALDYSTAHFLWNVCCLAALAITIGIIARTLGITFEPRLWPVLVLLLLSGPIWQHLFDGQLSLLLLALVTGTWAADRTGRCGWAGTLLGLATAIKLIPALLFLYLVLQRRWRTVRFGVASFAVSCLIALVVLGPDAFRGYLQEGSPQVARWRSSCINDSLTGLWHKLLDFGEKGTRIVPVVHAPAAARCLDWASYGIVLGVLALTIRNARSARQRDLAFSLTLIACLLVSLVTWHHSFVLLLLPLALVWHDPPRSRWERWVLLALLGILWLPNWRLCAFSERLLGYDATRPVIPALSATVFSLRLYGLLGLFGVVLRRCWSPDARETPPRPTPASDAPAMPVSCPVA